MKQFALSLLLALGVASAAPTDLEKRATVQGFDISHYQATVDFQGAYNDGARFVIIKVRTPSSFICLQTATAHMIKHNSHSSLLPRLQKAHPT